MKLGETIKMKTLPLICTILLFCTILLSGCAQIIVEDIPYEDGSICTKVKINTFMKNYDLKEMTSTSHTIKAKATAKPIPSVEVETDSP